MARLRYPASSGPTPPPLPPETRTVGQLVGETVRLYGRRFWASLALGVGPAAVGLSAAALPRVAQLPFEIGVGGVVLTGSYVAATAIAAELRPARRDVALALSAGVLAFAPAPFLLLYLFVPGVVWLALVGLVVPVVLVERRGLVGAFRRALQLARADLVHAVGTLATLTVTSFLSASVLFFLLEKQGQAAREAAAFLAVLVISPLLFLGSALLYFDQAARVGRPRGVRRRAAAQG